MLDTFHVFTLITAALKIDIIIPNLKTIKLRQMGGKRGKSK